MFPRVNQSVSVSPLFLSFINNVQSPQIKKPAASLLSQPIRSKIKTNHDLLARVFPLLAASTFVSSSDWFIELSATVVIGQSNYVGFGFTTFN